MKRWRSLLLGILLSALFLWFALRGLDWSQVGVVLRDIHWEGLALAAGIWSLGLAARALRWRALMGFRTPFRQTFHVLNIGFLINNTLPFRVGELARAYLIGREDNAVSGWAALSTILAERLLDMLAVVLMLAAVLPVLVVDPAAIRGGALLGGIAVLGFCTLLFFAFRPGTARRLLAFVLARIPALHRLNPESLLERVLDGLHPLTTAKGLFGTLAWTAVAWLCSAAGSWVLALAFPGLPQTPVMRAALTLSVVAASFSIIIPFTLASVGPFEAAAVFALLTAGISQEAAVAYALIWHAGVVITYAAWGVLGLLALGLNFSQVRQGAAALGERP